MCQQISLDQNKLFQETAVNRTWLPGGVGWRWARPTLSGQRPHLPGNPLRGSGLEGKEQGRAPWATPRFQGQRSGSVLSHGHGHHPSPFCSAVRSALLSPNTHASPGKDPDSLGSPGKGEKRVGKGGTSASHQGQDKDGAAAEAPCANSTPSPMGAVPVLWPRAPGLSPHRDPQLGRL